MTVDFDRIQNLIDEMPTAVGDHAEGVPIHRRTGLDQILGPDLPEEERYHAARVAAFWLGYVDKPYLGMAEACDDWFAIALSPEDVSNLIAFLERARHRMVTR